VAADVKPEQFVLSSFYFYKRRHHKNPEVIIGLDHPADIGHWSLTFYDVDSGILSWVPKD
jgi:hypothetical protein